MARVQPNLPPAVEVDRLVNVHDRLAEVSRIMCHRSVTDQVVPGTPLVKLARHGIVSSALLSPAGIGTAWPGLRGRRS